MGWTLIPNTGNRLLVVLDGVNQYNGAAAGTRSGTWQQGDVSGAMVSLGIIQFLTFVMAFKDHWIISARQLNGQE